MSTRDELAQESKFYCPGVCMLVGGYFSWKEKNNNTKTKSVLATEIA